MNTQENILAKTWLLHRGTHSVYNHFLETDRNIDHMSDPFFYVSCLTCGACEGQPLHQKKRYLGGFTNVLEDAAPDQTLYECIACSKKRIHHVLHIEIENLFE